MNFLLNFINSAFLKASSNSVRVLAYHDIPDAEKFEAQLGYLRKHYNIINIKALEDHLFLNKRLPKKSVLITFDDGDYSVLTNGLPILQKLKVPAVLFVITELIGTNKAFWWKRVEVANQNKGMTYLDSRKQVNKLKSVSNINRLESLEFLEDISARQLTTANLYEMEEQGMKIGNHTHTHPMIDKCTSSEVVEELQLTKNYFQKWNLSGYPIFAYPNGNWDEISEEILKENGIKMSFLFDHKLNTGEINPLRISRIRVNSYASLNEFKLKVSGLHSMLMHSGIISLFKK